MVDAEERSTTIFIKGEPHVEIEIAHNHCNHVGRTGLIIRVGDKEPLELGIHISDEEMARLVEALTR
jgi:hypothetical protein